MTTLTTAPAGLATGRGRDARLAGCFLLAVTLPLTFLANQVGGQLMSGWAWLLALLVVAPLALTEPLHPLTVRYLAPYLVFLAYGLVSLSWTDDLMKGGLTLIQLTVPALAYLVAWRAAAQVDRLLDRLAKICLGVLGLSVVLVVADKTIGLGGIQLSTRPVAISLAVLFTFATVNARSWLFTMLVGSVAILVAVLTGSRMAAAVLLLLLLFSPSLAVSWRWRMAIATLTVVLLVVLSHTQGFKERFFFDPHASLVDVLTLSDKVNTAGRRELWPRLVHTCSGSAEFGYGLGASYGLSDRLSGGTLDHPHNDYLRTYCDAGLLGSAVFWGFFLAVGVRSLRRSLRPASHRRLHAAAGLLVLAFLLFAVTDNPMVYTAHFMTPIALMIGLSDAAADRRSVRRPAVAPHRPPTRRFDLLVRIQQLRSRVPRSLTTKLSWSVVDQACSSLTNLAGGIVIARAGGPAVYGAFAVAVAVYLSAIGFQRSLVSTPLTVTSAKSEPAAMRSDIAKALTATLLLGAIASAVVLLGGWLTSGLFDQAAFAIAPWIALLLLQDFWRSCLFLQRRPRAAAANDACWGLGMLLALPLALTSHSLVPLVAFWGSGAALAAVVGFGQIRIRPAALTPAARWWSSRARAPGVWFMLDHVVFLLFTQASVFLLAALGGAAVTGGIRAVQTLLAPLGVLSAGAAALGVPELARLAATDDRRARRWAGVISLAITTVCLVYGATVLVVGARGLGFVFGAAFRRYEPAILPLVIGQLAIASSFGIDQYMSATARARARVKARIVAAVVTLPLLAMLTTRLGLSGAAWGMAIGYILLALGLRVAWRLRPGEPSSRLEVRRAGS
jgi:O-antigen/teichoic acid export membrane protein/O-antigen ligase